MNQSELKILLNDLSEKKLSPNDALKKLKNLPYENIDFAKIDHHRELRNGSPEVIFCPGKSVSQIKIIIQSLRKADSNILATKLTADAYKKLKTSLPQHAEYSEQGQTLVIRNKKPVHSKGLITIITAGTSDIPIAEEAAATAQLI
jgi:NCAIR mutase (PurE)-related protein